MIHSLIKYIFLVSLLLSGCSSVMLERYYAPDLSKKETYRNRNDCFQGGANDVALLNNPLISLEVRHSPHDLSIMTAGPWFFALIPAFPLNWILVPNNQKDYIDIEITVRSLSGDLVWNVESIKVILPDGREAIPIGMTRTGIF